MSNNIKQHLFAISFFMVVCVLYFAPQYQGKDVRQYDNVQANGTRASIERTIAETGEHPQWIDNMFGGMPSYTFDMDSVSKHVLDPLIYVINVIQQPASHYFILMLGFYFMAICFRIRPLVAMVGALAWGLSTYFFIIYTAGHIMKLVALIYVAPLIGSIYYAYSRNLLLGGSLAALFTALEIKSVHPQITYYFLFVILALIISIGVEQYKKGEVRRFFISSAALLGFAIMGIAANSVYLYYTLDYTKESTRGKEILISEHKEQDKGLDKNYITAWSYGKAETFNMLIPNLYGGTSEGGFPEDGELYNSLRKYKATQLTAQLPAYWGPQPMTSGPVYIGAVIIFLFVLSLFLLSGKLFIGMISVTILALMLAWGHNLMWFTDLFIDHFPLYNKFRTVSMILVVVEFTVPFLAMFALQKILDTSVDFSKKLSALRYSSLVVAGFLVLMFLFGEQFLSFTSPQDSQYGLPADVVLAMQADRIGLMQSDTARSLAFVLLTSLLVYMIMKLPKYKNYLLVAIGFLICSDLIPINKRFLNNDHFVPTQQAMEIPMTDIDRQILQDKSNYRVVNLTVSPFNDATTSMYHRSVGGYSAVKPRRYQDIIDRYLVNNSAEIYSLLNTKYFILNDGDTKKIMVNDKALGNAWFVDKVMWVDTPNQELDGIGQVKLENTAVISNEFNAEVKGKFSEPVEGDFITQTKYSPSKWTFEYSAKTDRLAVFSEMYFPNGWSAMVDGKQIELVRVDYDFFGAIVPAGSGEIYFEFNPPKLALVDGIGVVFAVSILILVIFSGVRTIRKSKKEVYEG